MKPRRHVFMFKPCFADLVQGWSKSTTIRPKRKREVRVGDVLDLRRWVGAPYRSKQRRIHEATCVEVRPIEIDRVKGLVWLDRRRSQRLLTAAQADALARGDGFTDRAEMIDWFERKHGLPFKGTLYRWMP